jgi:hypothetical protein
MALSWRRMSRKVRGTYHRVVNTSRRSGMNLQAGRQG